GDSSLPLRHTGPDPYKRSWALSLSLSLSRALSLTHSAVSHFIVPPNILCPSPSFRNHFLLHPFLSPFCFSYTLSLSLSLSLSCSLPLLSPSLVWLQPPRTSCIQTHY